jgi:thioredoxin-like negative regulator of GroEL
MAIIPWTAAIPDAHAVQNSSSDLSAADMFALADEARAAGLLADAAAIYDALTRDAIEDVRVEAMFRKGMMLADARQFADAAVAFRAVLAEKPDAVLARLELARMFAAMGDERSARQAIRQAQASGLPDAVAATVEQFALALRSSRRVGGSVEVGLAPDSNINRATQSRTLDTVIAPLTLSDDARARSGLGLKLAGQGFVRINLSDRLALLPRIAGDGTFYREQIFNDVSGSALLGLEWRNGKDRVSSSIGQTWRRYGDVPYAHTSAISLDWIRPLGPRAQLLVHGGASRANYLRNDLQDGGLYDLAISVEKALSTRSGLGATISGYRQTARDPGYSTVSGGVSAMAWQDIGKTTLIASTAAYRLLGDERLFLFADRRREWLLKASVGATFRHFKIAGFAPKARLVMERNYSTVGLYDYRRVSVELGIARAF